MKKIYCELHIFDLHQKVYVVDPSTGAKECVAITVMEELPEVVSAISSEKQIHEVLLSGNGVFSKTMSEEIAAYSKKNYNWNNIKVEVLE